MNQTKREFTPEQVRQLCARRGNVADVARIVLLEIDMDVRMGHYNAADDKIEELAQWLAGWKHQVRHVEADDVNTPSSRFLATLRQTDTD